MTTIPDLLKRCTEFSKIAADGYEDELLFKMKERFKDQALADKATWIVDIRPALFIKMTTEDTRGAVDLIDESPGIDFYMSPEVYNDMSVHPLLRIDKNTGRITGHEGRHRAGAVRKAGGKWFRIAVTLSPGSRSYKPSDMPMVWIGQFNGAIYDIKSLIAKGYIRIINKEVQKEFW